MPIVWNYWNNVISALQEIQLIKDEKEKEKIASEFFKGFLNEYTRDTNFLITRFLEIGTDVELLGVTRCLMDSLKESIFCYVNGQYLSTIASVGITAELFCVHIYKLFLENQGLSRSFVKSRIEKFSEISQREKIDTLFSVVGVDEHICQILHKIRKKRNENVHPHTDKDYKEDALDCLQDIIDILNIYSEIIKKQTELKNKEEKE